MEEAPEMMTREERKRQQNREWYLRHRDEHKQRTASKYYADHETNKTVARERARAKKAELQTLRAEVASLRAKISV